MLLAIDIGNTNISFGVFSATKRGGLADHNGERGGFAKYYGEKGNRIIKRFDILTKIYNLKKLSRLLNKFKVDNVIICSVVPKVTNILEKDIRRLFSLRPYILGKNLHAPIKNLYRKPAQVGQDRLVNAYAGIRLYGSPLIVVDFGTAITFDVISTNKEYLGGMILPGLRISLDALFEKTALLPKINLSAPGEFIGRDTKSSMLSGLVYGFAVLTDDLSKRIKEKIGRRAKVIGTGGNINLIGRYCRKIDKIDKDLTLKGLNLIYRNFLENFH
jgi:type III pantothenate kinase